MCFTKASGVGTRENLDRGEDRDGDGFHPIVRKPLYVGKLLEHDGFHLAKTMTTKSIPCLAGLFLTIAFAASAARAADAPIASETLPKPVELWPGGAPGATGNTDEDRPAVYPFLPPADRNTGAAILVCPGGGYTTRCADFEGVLVARWLNARGIAAFVLRYRIRPMYGMKESLRDAQRGMQFIRAHADEYHIAADRLGIIGFSAGADLAANAAMRPVAGTPDAQDPLDRLSSRPDFQVLVYGSAPLPAAAGEGNNNAAAGAANAAAGTPNAAAPAQAKDALPAPPTFMFCTAEDPGHLNGMLTLYGSLRRARVPVEAHFFQVGEHGVGFAQGDPVLGVWPDLLFNWLRQDGFLTGRPRVAVRGVVTLDGEPLPRGEVILTPLDPPAAPLGAPPVVGRVFNTGPTRGEFAVPASLGPVPGRYRVEVRLDATRWLSNSRDPVQLKMAQKQRAGTMTDADRQEWIDYARKRDLSPSIEDQRFYRHKRPGDKEEMVVEIKEGGENRVDLEVVTK
jgi:acetyl esterase/lipase